MRIPRQLLCAYLEAGDDEEVERPGHAGPGVGGEGAPGGAGGDPRGGARARWVEALTHAAFNALDLGSRLEAVLWLANTVLDSPTVRCARVH